jgi:hypothetical protein
MHWSIHSWPAYTLYFLKKMHDARMGFSKAFFLPKVPLANLSTEALHQFICPRIYADFV